MKLNLLLDCHRYCFWEYARHAEAPFPIPFPFPFPVLFPFGCRSPNQSPSVLYILIWVSESWKSEAPYGAQVLLPVTATPPCHPFQSLPISSEVSLQLGQLSWHFASFRFASIFYKQTQLFRKWKVKMLNATLHANNGLRGMARLLLLSLLILVWWLVAWLVVTRKCRPPWRDQNMNFVNELHM